ncbi:MAG: biotin synthase BioB [Spirochaetae bacterium HGW-Spirochaetae-6]|nr:MAG: biotin synthase BioB [Spirochaetae bacterium HGW-Spirochaetae-6]
MLHPAIEKAYSILNHTPLARELAEELTRISGEDILDLLSLANKVKNSYRAESHVCSIINAKSNLCGEKCSYCAQSAVSTAEIPTFPLLEPDDILADAQKLYADGVRSYGIVTSGIGYMSINPEFEKILRTIELLHQELPELKVCAGLGILSQETAEALAQVKIEHYNHNLQVNPEKYATLVSDSHTIEERIQTLRYLKKAGVKLCSGGIFGLGESLSDRVALAFTLKNLDVDVIPLNVLIAVPGTPLENKKPISASEAALSFALFRLILPDKLLKFAAGRETLMKDFQGLLMLCGINGFLTGGYLTTRGRSLAEDRELIVQLEQFSHAKR